MKGVLTLCSEVSSSDFYKYKVSFPYNMCKQKAHKFRHNGKTYKLYSRSGRRALLKFEGSYGYSDSNALKTEISSSPLFPTVYSMIESFVSSNTFDKVIDLVFGEFNKACLSPTNTLVINWDKTLVEHDNSVFILTII